MSPSKDPPSSGSSTSKIAIKGFSLSSKPKPTSSNSKPGANPSKAPPSSLGKRPRTHFGHDDSDSEDDHDRRHGKHEVVTGFEDGKVLHKQEKVVSGPLVIPKLGNSRDWRGDARRMVEGRKNLLPAEVQAEMRDREARANGEKEKEKEGEKVEGIDVVNSKDGEMVWGLSVRKREAVSEEAGTNGHPTEETPDAEPVKERTADEEAIAALLGEKVKKGPDLVIPTLSAPPKQTEESAFRNAVASAPDASTLEDYERIPVEEFGAALLRGMGWKGEANASDKANKGKEVKRRQNLLGLGAKELKDAEELGAWVQKSDVKRLKSGSGGGRERKPGVSEYKRERDERRYREGGYREEERRERNGGGLRGRDHRERDRRDDRDRERNRERDHRDRRR